MVTTNSIISNLRTNCFAHVPDLKITVHRWCGHNDCVIQICNKLVNKHKTLNSYIAVVEGDIVFVIDEKERLLLEGLPSLIRAFTHRLSIQLFEGVK